MQGEVAVPSFQGSVNGGGAAAAAPPPVQRRGRTQLTAYGLLAPTALFLAVFFALPMAQALVLAFQDAQGAWSLSSIQRMVGDINFAEAVKLTLLFAAVVIPIQTALALCMAMLLASGLRWSGFFLYVWAIPLGISDLAAGVVWLSIFTDRGYLNSVFVGLGLGDVGYPFLSYENPVSLFLCAAIAEVWRATSIVMVILLSGLQVIPKEYAEAADVFGASPWQRFTKVTLPLLRPSLQVALILRTILAFQAFAVVIALAGRQLPVLLEEAYHFYY
ncbi:MAG: sugar ABC transporter permease, partial [Dehalococcoidia bacterium]|nr:sugar ABC transporter permease [Dehalococcoidia bacterium]